MNNIQDILYVRFRVSDLARQAQFLQDFGMATEISNGQLIGRGTDPKPFVYAAEQGEPTFLAVGFEASSREHLEALSAYDNVPIEANPMPGGGEIVRLTDPSGHQVEVVFGFTSPPALEPPTRLPLNMGTQRDRLGQRVAIEGDRAFIKRLGHCVLMVNDFRESEAWYKARFGLITSDEVVMERDGSEQALGAFMRCDRGDEYVDHHTLFLVHAGHADFNHAAFEVSDWDVLMKSHFDLQRSGYTHSFGVGKHILGSQVFDYWKDPDGFMVEHYTDGDLFNAAWGSHKKTVQDLMGTLWGPDGAPGG